MISSLPGKQMTPEGEDKEVMWAAYPQPTACPGQSRQEGPVFHSWVPRVEWPGLSKDSLSALGRVSSSLFNHKTLGAPHSAPCIHQG